MTIFKLEGWKILIVDDDEDSVSMFAELLRHEGSSVDKTQSPIHALQLLKTRSYDLLISDITMPEMNGHDFVQEIRALNLDSRLVAMAMTGHGELAGKNQGKNVGFDIHLLKPVSVKQIKAALAQHVNDPKPQ